MTLSLFVEGRRSDLGAHVRMILKWSLNTDCESAAQQLPVVAVSRGPCIVVWRQFFRSVYRFVSVKIN